MRGDHDLVTGDAVVLDLPLAHLASRGLALCLDATLQVLVLLVGFVVIVIGGAGDDALAQAAVLTLFVLTRVGYSVLFETLCAGRTPGKMALGLRVVRDDGGPIGFRHALTRGLAGVIVDFGPVWAWSAIGLTTSMCSARSKRVGDYLAGTVVIRDRAPAPDPLLVAMPPHLAVWASHLDLSGVSDEQALTIRRYLTRWHELRPLARDALAAELANDVVARVGSPPPGTPPADVLAAVLAERRARGRSV